MTESQAGDSLHAVHFDVAAGRLLHASADFVAGTELGGYPDDLREPLEPEFVVCALRDRCVVGVAFGRLQGTVDFAPVDCHPPYAWLQLVVVAQQSRRQRIGRQLLREFEREAREQGASFVGLQMHPPSEVDRLRYFYERCDYYRYRSGPFMGRRL